MAKVRIGHFVEAQILEAIEIDYIDESEVLSPADDHFMWTRAPKFLLSVSLRFGWSSASYRWRSFYDSHKRRNCMRYRVRLFAICVWWIKNPPYSKSTRRWTLRGCRRLASSCWIGPRPRTCWKLPVVNFKNEVLQHQQMLRCGWCNWGRGVLFRYFLVRRSCTNEQVAYGGHNQLPKSSNSGQLEDLWCFYVISMNENQIPWLSEENRWRIEY